MHILTVNVLEKVKHREKNVIHRDLDLYFQGHKISGNPKIFSI